MKKVKIILNLIIITAFTILLSGCWNYKDIDELNMVAGFAVDKSTHSNKYLVTAEIVDTTSEGRGTKFISKKIEEEGETVLDAIRNMIKFSGKKLYFSHAKVVIISKDIACEGVKQIIDFIMRDHEPRSELYLMVSKEKTAKEILEQQSIGGDINGLGIFEIVNSERSLSKAPMIQTYQFIQALSSQVESPILPTVGSAMNQGQRIIELSGTAVFKKDKLVGFLNEDDTKYLLFVRNSIKGGVLPEMKAGENSSHSVTLEIFTNKTKIIPKYSNGRISININVKTSVGIDEHGGEENYINEKGRGVLKNEAEKSLETNIKDVIKKVQNKYGTDVFGFGKSVKIKMPSMWKSISYNWDNLFKNIDVNVSSTMYIKNSEYLSEPIKVGE